MLSPQQISAASVLVAILLLVSASLSSVHAECSDGAVELVGLPVSHAGIVRVCVNGVWGTICAEQTTPWSEKNSLVACRSAGYAGAVTTQLILSVTQKNIVAYDPIHYSNVECIGTETSLSDCQLSDTISTTCDNHNFDVAVSCKSFSESDAPIGDVRLLGDPRNGRGAVEYYDEREGWTGVCVDAFESSEWLANSAAATVVCRQLGYEEGTTYIESFSEDDAISTDRVRNPTCDPATDFSLADCRSGPTVCNTDNTVTGGIECSLTGAENYSVRLVGGDDRSGVVEVAFNGRWGTICEDSDWSVEDATVICTQLGFTDGVPMTTSGSYPNYHSGSVKPYWLGEVVCYSEDRPLRECSFGVPLGYTTCTHTSNSAELSCYAAGGGGLPPWAISLIIIVSIVVVVIVGIAIYYKQQEEEEERERRAATVQLTIIPTSAPRARTTAPAPTLLHTTDLQPEPERPDRELTDLAPPPYQSAVSYPTATLPQPPAYPGKAEPYPAPYPSAPSNIGFEAYPPPFSAPPPGTH